MKYKEINRKYTEIVQEWMAKGYVINTSTMSGHQGEIAKIDLTNGIAIIRVSIHSFSNFRLDTSGVKILVGRSFNDATPHNQTNYDTIWTDRMENISTESFYKLCASRFAEDWYGTEEEAKAAADKRFKRWEQRHIWSTEYQPNEKALAIAKRIVREKMGYKRVDIPDVKLVKEGRKYIVKYHGKAYTLK